MQHESNGAHDDRPVVPGPVPRPTYRARVARGADFLASGVTLVAGGCTLAAFLARHGFRLEQLSHFRVQYLWALAIAAGWLAARGRVWQAMAAAGLAAVNFALVVPLYVGPTAQRVDRPATRAMSLNVHYYNHAYHRTLDLIRQENPDFVLLLEVTPEWARAMRELTRDYPHARVLPHRDSGGVALYSRLPLESLRVPGQADNRLPIRVTLPNGQLTLLCAHPPSPQTPDDLEFRNGELRTMGEWAAAQDGPVMILGDLNITSWSPYFADLLETSGLRDSRLGFGVSGTWPAAPLPLRIPIDHCLVSRQIVVVDRRVGPAVGSDHRPIIVDFSIVEP